MNRQDERKLHHRKERELANKEEKLRDQAPVRQWEVMPVWFLAAGSLLIVAVLVIWFMVLS
jgi:type VI protein secretion system component VasF